MARRREEEEAVRKRAEENEEIAWGEYKGQRKASETVKSDQ
jgi:hypothetical protein